MRKDPGWRYIAAVLVVGVGCSGFLLGLANGKEAAASLSATFALVALYLLFGKNPPRDIL